MSDFHSGLLLVACIALLLNGVALLLSLWNSRIRKQRDLWRKRAMQADASLFQHRTATNLELAKSSAKITAATLNLLMVEADRAKIRMELEKRNLRTGQETESPKCECTCPFNLKAGMCVDIRPHSSH